VRFEPGVTFEVRHPDRLTRRVMFT